MSSTNYKKVVVVGDGVCGKTHLLLTLKNEADQLQNTAYFLEKYYKDISIDNAVINLELWDTPGQEDYQRLRSLMYPETTVILICFSVVHINTLRNAINVWFPEVKQSCPEIPIILVGNKMDLRAKNPDEVISTAEGKAAALKMKAFAYLECSALTNEGVREVFECAARASLLQDPKEKNRCNIM